MSQIRFTGSYLIDLSIEKSIDGHLVRAVTISGYSMTSSITASGADYTKNSFTTLIWALADLVLSYIP